MLNSIQWNLQGLKVHNAGWIVPLLFRNNSNNTFDSTFKPQECHNPLPTSPQPFEVGQNFPHFMFRELRVSVHTLPVVIHDRVMCQPLFSHIQVRMQSATTGET